MRARRNPTGLWVKKADDLYDPYRGCDVVDECRHELTAGVLVGALLAGDGPHPPKSGRTAFAST